MTGSYFLLLGWSPDDSIRWASTRDGAVTESGQYKNAEDLLSFRALLTDGDKVVAILPGEQVVSRLIASPPRNVHKFLAAAKYLLEDNLGESLDEIHIVTSMMGKKGVVVATKDCVMERWIQTFKHLDFMPDVIAPDYFCLPINDGKPTLLFDEGRISVGFGDHGFSIENNLAKRVLPLTFAKVSLDDINVFGSCGPNGEGVEWVAGMKEPLTTMELLALYARGIHQSPTVNLLQGKYKTRRSWSDGLAVWRRAGALVASLLVLFLAWFVADGVRDLRVAATLESRATALHAKTFPDAAIDDPRAHARTLLAADRRMSFVMLSTLATEAIAEAKHVRIERLRYDRSRGQFVMSVRSSQDNHIETFREALLARGVTAVDSGGYRRAGEDWVGDMVVRLP